MAHRDRRDIVGELSNVTIKPGQRYQHYRTQGIYMIKDIAVLEATEELAVVYFDESFPELIWVRSLADFASEVGDRVRFSLLP